VRRAGSATAWCGPFVFAAALALGACGGGGGARGGDGAPGDDGAAPTAGGESGGAGDGTAAAASDDPDWAAKVAAGEARYDAVCGTCHPGGDEDSGPRLIDLRWTADRMRAQIRNGSGRMRPIPPARLSDADLENVLAWMTTIRAVQR
jgi:mono/diheme cytochrome c family protein